MEFRWKDWKNVRSSRALVQSVYTGTAVLPEDLPEEIFSAGEYGKVSQAGGYHH
jgi:hypothetical protein